MGGACGTHLVEDKWEHGLAAKPRERSRLDLGVDEKIILKGIKK
jgi:hypothetical protein